MIHCNVPSHYYWTMRGRWICPSESERTKIRCFQSIIGLILFALSLDSLCLCTDARFSLRAIMQSSRRRAPELSDLISLLFTLNVQPWVKTIPFKYANHPWGAGRLSLKVLLWPCRAVRFKIQCRPPVMLQSTPLQYQPTVRHYWRSSNSMTILRAVNSESVWQWWGTYAGREVCDLLIKYSWGRHPVH